MSGGRYLLLFLDDAAPGWLRLKDGVVAARGGDGSPPPLPDDAAVRDRVVAVVPAADVTVQWVDLPALAPAQAAASAASRSSGFTSPSIAVAGRTANRGRWR